MNDRKIVLDLDGVIADIGGALDKWISDKYDTEDVDYSSWLITDNNADQAMEIFNNPLFWKNMKPYEDAWYCVNHWFYWGFDVHIVTARRCNASIKETQPWLDMWRINTMSPIFTNINEKHDVIESINPIFVVEDNPHEVDILRGHGIKAMLRKQWYNKEYWNDFPTVDSLWDIDWKN